jgi:hypothetical protein
MAHTPRPIEKDLGDSWIMDRSRSESVVPYLRLMGLSEMAIEAWAKAEKETDTYKVYRPDQSFTTLRHQETSIKSR